MNNGDIGVLRDLAKQYAELASRDAMAERRDLWRRHNSLQRTRTLMYVRAFAWPEMPQAKCVCTGPFYRRHENWLRSELFRSTFGDDFIFEPWMTVRATYVLPERGLWGLEEKWIAGDDVRGSKQMDPTIRDPEDAKKLVQPHHVIDEAATARDVAKLRDAIGDIITVNVDRSPACRVWNGDLSTNLARLRGLEQIMWDMTDRPEWLHGVLAFMRDGVLQNQAEAERAGDWSLANHENQAMPYAEELDDPAPNSAPVTRDKLWTYCASQETTLVGPKMFDEFMLQYQIPIMAPFALAAYGCCEDLTQKIGVLRQIPNLRRIGVAPVANVAKCAEQIGTDYVLSYRPSPADMVSYRFDEARIRGILRRDLEASRGCHVDITLKDVETVESDPDRVRRWVAVTRSVLEEMEL